VCISGTSSAAKQRYHGTERIVEDHGIFIPVPIQSIGLGRHVAAVWARRTISHGPRVGGGASSMQRFQLLKMYCTEFVDFCILFDAFRYVVLSEQSAHSVGV